MANETKTDKVYNKTVAGLWLTKGGNLKSMRIDQRVFDSIQEIGMGGVLFIKFIDDERRKSETSPHAYLEYVTPEEAATWVKKEE